MEEHAADVIWWCVRLQGQGVEVEEEQLLATGSPPRQWGKNICLVSVFMLK